MFAIVVMAGVGSVSGTLVAAVLPGVVESGVLTKVETSWTPVAAFEMLLLVRRCGSDFDHLHVM